MEWWAPPREPRDTEDPDGPKIGLVPGIPTIFTFIVPVKCPEQIWFAGRVVADDVPNGPAVIEFWLSVTDAPLSVVSIGFLGIGLHSGLLSKGTKFSDLL